MQVVAPHNLKNNLDIVWADVVTHWNQITMLYIPHSRPWAILKEFTACSSIYPSVCSLLPLLLNKVNLPSITTQCGRFLWPTKWVAQLALLCSGCSVWGGWVIEPRFWHGGLVAWVQLLRGERSGAHGGAVPDFIRCLTPGQGSWLNLMSSLSKFKMRSKLVVLKFPWSRSVFDFEIYAEQFKILQTWNLISNQSNYTSFRKLNSQKQYFRKLPLHKDVVEKKVISMQSSNQRQNAGCVTFPGLKFE